MKIFFYSSAFVDFTISKQLLEEGLLVEAPRELSELRVEPDANNRVLLREGVQARPDGQRVSCLRIFHVLRIVAIVDGYIAY